MAVTHDMIAVKLGINRTTVTKALKGDPSIKKETRQKVKETATLMGYDFKQSQRENRREGKRFFVHEDVKVSIYAEDYPPREGVGQVLNLSSSGALIRLKEVAGSALPAKPFKVKAAFCEQSLSDISLPEGRVLRVIFYNATEIAIKFMESQTLSNSVLDRMEQRSFDRLEANKSPL